jgi:DNA-binding NarL/FixJ family response regulator
VADRPLRVLIADDHAAFRRAARRLLNARGYAVLGEAVSADDAFALVERLGPDAVLLDVRLGEECGFDVARALTRECPGLAVLLVSAEEDGVEPQRVCESGACGFMPKAELARVDLAALWGAAVHPIRTM